MGIQEDACKCRILGSKWLEHWEGTEEECQGRLIAKLKLSQRRNVPVPTISCFINSSLRIEREQEASESSNCSYNYGDLIRLTMQLWFNGKTQVSILLSGTGEGEQDTTKPRSRQLVT